MTADKAYIPVVLAPVMSLSLPIRSGLANPAMLASEVMTATPTAALRAIRKAVGIGQNSAGATQRPSRCDTKKKDRYDGMLGLER
jgi:hypothetical protein